jgi:hypothetical protein
VRFLLQKSKRNFGKNSNSYHRREILKGCLEFQKQSAAVSGYVGTYDTYHRGAFENGGLIIISYSNTLIVYLLQLNICRSSPGLTSVFRLLLHRPLSGALATTGKGRCKSSLKTEVSSIRFDCVLAYYYQIDIMSDCSHCSIKLSRKNCYYYAGRQKHMGMTPTILSFPYRGVLQLGFLLLFLQRCSHNYKSIEVLLGYHINNNKPVVINNQ